jgi:hypothetical protein
MALTPCLRCERVLPCDEHGFCLRCVQLNEMEAYGVFTRLRCYPPDGVYRPEAA